MGCQDARDRQRACHAGCNTFVLSPEMTRPPRGRVASGRGGRAERQEERSVIPVDVT